MAITKETKIEKIEVVGEYKAIQVATDTVIKEDGAIISRSIHRRAFDCGRIDNDDNWIDTDISGETAEVQAICNTSWTDEVKAAYKKHLIDTKDII